jgi:type VI secretion system protein ImpM
VSAGSNAHAPGWYGKLPSLGDFASRRLPDEFIRPWDEWLQVVLQASRASLGEAWLDCYLTMPIWRFVLLPGLLGPSGWAGVLMPSVDRVGRHFPLTLAVEPSSGVGVAEAVFDRADWFARLEGIALTVLDPTCDVESFDRALVDHVFTSPQPAELGHRDGAVRRLSSVDEFSSRAKAEALQAWSQLEGWNGLWWTAGRVDGDPLMRVCAALPTPVEFGELMQARSNSTRTLDVELPRLGTVDQ